MTQPLEENRLYSTWSRTPGKPSSSSNIIDTKISNISSTDCGVSRVLNWNSDNNKFCIYDSNPWSSNSTLQSKLIDNTKKLSWMENNNKIPGNNSFTFGFSSQYPVNNEVNSQWVNLSRNYSSNFLNNEANNSTCWNNSQNIDSLQNEHYLSRNNSIWAANQNDSNNSITTTADIENSNNNINVNNFHFHDQISKSSINNNKSILPQESDKSEFQMFSAFSNSVVNSDIDTSLNLNKSENSCNIDKSIEHQTWAQAAGKGLQSSSLIKDDSIKQEVNEQIQSLINRIDGWGNHTVDQSTPWIFENEIISDANNEKRNSNISSNLPLSQRIRSNTESNVWTNEPPNGVGVWESHYENLGDCGSCWRGTGTEISNDKVKQSSISNWEIRSINDNNLSNTTWNTDRDDSSVWNSGVGNIGSQKLPWGILGTVGKQDQVVSAPIGTGSRISASLNITGSQRNTNVSAPINSGSINSEINDQIHRHNNFYQNQNANAIHNNRLTSNSKPKPSTLTNSGFRKEDSVQHSVFNSSMELNRSLVDIKSSSLNQSNMINPRSDWNLQHENFRPNNNSMEPDSNVMMSSGYINQSIIPTNNNQPLKSQMMHQQQQHMTMPMGNRLTPDNHMLEKQIITEIIQLHSKQQELIQRINGLRSISGSQAFILEMTRTLNEVRQQLSTQHATLKVIRSQMSMVNNNNNNQLPNGLMNNNTNSSNQHLSMVSRTMQPSTIGGVPLQSQSGLASDLSAQMNDLKLQKNRMDLWFQGGNLPSSSIISSCMGTDKSGAFYNHNIPNGGGGQISPQLFNNFSRNSQVNCGSNQRQPNQIWQSRMMQNSVTMTSSNANLFNSISDSHSVNSGLNIGEDMNSISNNVFNHTNPSHLKIPNISNSAGVSSETGTNSTANSAMTTALSWSQTLPSSSVGGRVSSAFSSSHDISHISANISEFIPGQPWSGISYSYRDDLNVTLGTGPRSLLSITNDHLEKLANSSVNSLSCLNDVGGTSSGSGNNIHRLSNNLNGVCSGVSRNNMTYILIRDLPSHINMEMLKNVITPINFPGLIQMHPNLASRWVLLHFTSNDEALKAYKVLFNKVGVIELLSDQEVNQRYQFSNCVASPVIPCSGMMDFHQSQQQSHYLH